jgi:hypothetical protein
MMTASRSLAGEILFFVGIFALLFIAIESSSAELGLRARVEIHPLPTLEAQREVIPLGLP